MGILKGLGLWLFSSLLFLSLTIFGVAFTINSTALSPDFITEQIESLDVSSLVEEFTIEQVAQEDFPQEFNTALIDTIDKLEDPVKVQITAAIHDIFDYLLGKSESIDLAVILDNTFLNSAFVDSLLAELDLSSLVAELVSEQIGEGEFQEKLTATLVNTITANETEIKDSLSAAADPIFDYLLGQTSSIDLADTLRNTVLTADFVTSLVAELDLSSLTAEFLDEQLEQLTGAIPEEMAFLVEHLDDIIDGAIAELEPTLIAALIDAADPLLDYLLGESSSLSVIISLESVKASLEEPLRTALVASLPPVLVALAQSEVDRLFDDFFGELIGMIPSTFELTETLIPAEIPAQVAEALAGAEDGLYDTRQSLAETLTEAEDGLEEVRKYVGYFQMGYRGLLGLMALLIIGIVLLHREVKGATRRLGITFLTYGVIEFAGILVAKNLAGPQLAKLDIPAAFQELSTQLTSSFASPIQTLSLGLLIGGVILIAVSFVYPRWRRASE